MNEWQAFRRSISDHPGAAAGVRGCDPTPAERKQYAGVLRHVIECLRSTGRFTDEEGEATNQLEDLLVILEARAPDVKGARPLTREEEDAAWDSITEQGCSCCTAAVRLFCRVNGIQLADTPGMRAPEEFPQSRKNPA